MLPVIMLFITVLGLSFAAVVIRADPKSWDNRIFAAMGVIDASMSGYRGLVLLLGQSLTEINVVRYCSVGALIISWLSVEFSYSYPFGRPASARLRAVGLTWTLANLVITFLPGIQAIAPHIQSWEYFLPMFLIMLWLQRRNMKRATGDARTGNMLVVGAIAFRWAVAIFTYNIAMRISQPMFYECLIFEAVVATLISYVLLGHAVLRGHLFSVRGLLAEVLIYEGIALAVVALTAFAVETALRVAPSGVALRVMLVAAALIPLGLVTAGARMGKKVERALRNVAPRNALKEGILARVAAEHDTAEGLVKAIKEALVEMSVGGQVRFWRAEGFSGAPSDGVLPHMVAERLARGNERYLRPGNLYDLPNEDIGDLLVAVRSSSGIGPGRLFGGLSVSGGQLDRASLLTAMALAEHLALKLENFSLFAELEESRRLATLGSFAAAIAHDIRTPLTSVQMNVQILRGKAKSLTDDDMEYFDIALDELKRLNGHISELLDYAKPVAIAATPVDLREVADDAARGMEPILTDRRVSLAREHDGGAPLARGDAQRLRQVLWNLLDNAAKASDAGGAIVIRTRTTGAKQVAIEVADSGRGIADSDLPRIFEPFFTTRPDGTGLGLAICQKLVRAHAGEIQVRSSPGKGSTFTVLLPAA